MRDCLYTFIIIILCTSVNINSRISVSSTRNDTLFCPPSQKYWGKLENAKRPHISNARSEFAYSSSYTGKSAGS